MNELKKLYEEVKKLTNENREDSRIAYNGRTFRSKPEVDLSEDCLSFGFYEEPIGEDDWHYQAIIRWKGGRYLYIHIRNLVSRQMRSWEIELDEFHNDLEWYDRVKDAIEMTCLWNTNICGLYTFATNCELYPELTMDVERYENMVNFLKA